VSELKVCIASGIFPPDKGGPAQFASAFSQWSSKKGIETSVLSLTDNEDEFRKIGELSVKLISRQKNLLARYLQTIREIVSIGRDHTLLINGLFIETLFASAILRHSYVAKVPGDIVWERARNQGATKLDIDRYQGNEDLPKRIMRWLFSQSLKRAKFVLAPSRHMASLIEEWGVPRAKIRVVRNSVDSSIFSQTQIDAYEFDLITVCRLTPWKGVSEIIREASARKLSLCVIGSGPEENSLKRLASELGANVTFLGELPQAEIPNYILKSRCFLLNSAYEGSPHALLEAMSLGSLVIARDSTGTSEVIVDGRNGLLCKSSQELGEKLELVFQPKFDAREIKRAASETIRHDYDREKIFYEILDILKEST